MWRGAVVGVTSCVCRGALTFQGEIKLRDGQPETPLQHVLKQKPVGRWRQQAAAFCFFCFFGSLLFLHGSIGASVKAPRGGRLVSVYPTLSYLSTVSTHQAVITTCERGGKVESCRGVQLEGQTRELEGLLHRPQSHYLLIITTTTTTKGKVEIDLCSGWKLQA